jgi:hypothetical protein
MVSLLILSDRHGSLAAVNKVMALIHYFFRNISPISQAEKRYFAYNLASFPS